MQNSVVVHFHLVCSDLPHELPSGSRRRNARKLLTAEKIMFKTDRDGKIKFNCEDSPVIELYVTQWADERYPVSGRALEYDIGEGCKIWYRWLYLISKKYQKNK